MFPPVASNPPTPTATNTPPPVPVFSSAQFTGVYPEFIEGTAMEEE